ncbi:leucine-rich repeats and immunoglobulin-like domains protein 2 [Antedon mediterranea]|uniref:leucine-rich repeats and immunoglobulin-like domains protein 2 n=1 Tax=Antedon mediterranea TaxID=105859 RepID=UPI003AF83134
MNILRYVFILFQFYFVNRIVATSTEFIYHPRAETAIEGTVVKLTCGVEGVDSESTFSWIKNGVTLTNGKDILESSPYLDRNLFVDFGWLTTTSIYYTLEISNVLHSDSGEYACIVNHNGFEVKSNTAYITVNQLPHRTYPLCEQIGSPVKEGKQVNLRCEGEVINPPIELKLSRSMPGNQAVTILNKRTTPIINSFVANRVDNNAIFNCQLTTPANTSIVRTCSIGPLNVWYKPNVTIQHAGISLSGREAIFICQADANPPVDFTWQFDPILNIERYVIDDIGQVMRILNVDIDDNGLLVKCIAKNTVGQVTSHVIMEVIGNKEDDKPKTNAIESVNEKQAEKKSISLSVLLAVVSVLVLVIVFAIIVPVYYFCICSKKEETVVIAQPEVYFEPQDRLTLPLPNKRNSVLWRRSFGAQVPTDRDVDAMYLEIQSDHYIFTPDSRGNTLPY